MLRNKDDIKNFFDQLDNTKFYGVGVDSFNRAYFSREEFPSYTILALKKLKETALISKDIQSLVIEDHIQDISTLKENGITILKDEKVVNLLAKSTNNYILPYKNRQEIEKICQENNWKLAITEYELAGNTLENKILFRKLVLNKSLFPQFSFESINKANYYKIKEMLGDQLVLQYPISSGGKGTFIIGNEKEFNKAINKIKKMQIKGENRILISKRVAGIPASVSCIATRWGTFYSPIQIQINDIKEVTSPSKGSGVFNGHDWTLSKIIPNSLNEQLANFIKEYGKAIYKMGYKGFFGLDLIVNLQSNKVFIIECNPRLTGALPVLDMIQEYLGKIKFISLHLLEFIAEFENDLDIKVSYREMQKELLTEKIGSHLIISSKFKQPVKYDIQLKPGVYKIENDNLKYLKDGYKISHLENTNEFIFTEMVNRHDFIKGYGRIARILSLNSLVDKDSNLTSFTTNIINQFYKNTKIVK